ncbi:unnamed protein product [Rotaria sordida]|uniref:Uncharacterized protein n=1 Tax=Rotaria sordida TaxID=392033 RepID=A0A819F3H6_9BILA|nr:unnamed protein product [Rotaria sordida]
MISGFSTSISESKLSTSVSDLFINALIKAIKTPISLNEVNPTLSVDIILENDVFTLDDVLRLSIQQFILALYDNRNDLVPEDWETQYPAYSKVLQEVNNVLDLIGKRTLSEIHMNDIRPLIKSLTPEAFVDLQQLIRKINQQIQKQNDESAEKEEL